MSQAIVPVSQVPLNVRLATMGDLPFMDSLQKKYGKALGYFPRKQFEGYVEMGAVLIAEEGEPQRHRDTEGRSDDGLASVSPCLGGYSSSPTPLGYVISRDRYLKRDELGVVYQLCVVPGVQRKLVGASLVKAALERAAYGCRLFCCWCAQDLPANEFWESMGFVPLAFRAGSDKKRRVHIFWQKRICEGDDATPWWYPFQTNGGAIRADRVVFPIPAGVHWRDVRAVEVPVLKGGTGFQPVKAARALTHGLKTRATKDAGGTPAPRGGSGPGPGKVGMLVGGRIKYVDQPGYVAPVAPEVPRPAVGTSVPLLPEPETKTKREKKPAEKVDPAFLAKVRELRDRYLEHVNASEGALVSQGKYDVTRVLGGSAASPAPLPLRSPATLPAPRAA